MREKQENIVDYYNTTDSNFWRMLAKENQQRHKEVNAGGKCCESRELIIEYHKTLMLQQKKYVIFFKRKISSRIILVPYIKTIKRE